MKNLFIVTAFAGVIAFAPSCGQKLKESQVPAAAKTAFQKQYPGTKATWEKENGKYEVNFDQNGVTMSAIIDENGTIVETESDIATNELPQEVQTYVKEHYAGATIKEASKIVTSAGELTYEALVNGKDVIFDSNGKFIKEVKE